MQPIIEVHNISKQYRLGTIGTGSMTHDLNRWWHRLRGKEDPYLRIGEANDRSTKGSSEYVFALRDISFTVQPGEVLGIIGRNGAGKSTLLKILSRITTPSTGSIKLGGRVASLLEVGTGMHPELTGRENIYLNGAILGMRKKEIDRKLDAIVDFSGVERYLDTPVKRYSSGMHVRLGFAVAAHLDPEILIVDEVLAVGDAEFQKKCLGKMNEVSRKEGRTVLFVSHNMGTIGQLCPNAFYMEKGSIISKGSTHDVIGDYLKMQRNIEGEYLFNDAEVIDKVFFFRRIYLTDSDSKEKSNFAFHESITVNFEFTIKEIIPGQQIGVGMQDKLNNRIFTTIKEINYFTKNGIGTFKGKVVIPGGNIAPNHYSFVCALWTKEGKVYDIRETVCSCKIFDTGTELALYEGIDYGSFILNCTWLKD